MRGNRCGRGPRRTRGALLCLFVLAAAVPSTVAGKTPDDTVVAVTYARNIKPVLDKHCVDCHGGWFPKAGLRLDSLKGIHEGGRSGPAIIPGEPAKGWLMRSLRLEDGRRGQMPPGKQRLSDEETDLIREWIQQGAK